jgi:drug/metabolite transporter (DMT)-like permease
MPALKSDRLRGALYGISAAAIWGGLYVVSDVVLETIPPFTLLTIRLLFGLAIIGALLYARPEVKRPVGRQWLPLSGVGLVGFGISVGAQFVGTDLSTAVNGALITSAAPAFILFFAALILKESLNVRLILAILLASAGVLVIIDPSQADFGSQTFLGDLALALAALTWGLYSVLVRWVSRDFDTLVVTFWGFVGGLIFCLPAMLIELSQQGIGQIDPPVILGVLYLSVVAMAGAMWLWNRAFALVEAGTASLFFFAQPLVGAGLGVLLLGQTFTPKLALGSALIFGGVLLSLSAPPAKKTD